MTTDTSLFARLGGTDAIGHVTSEFYERVMTDPLLAPFFADTDMTRQAGMLASFLAMAFGGPDGYHGRDLRQAHEGMGIGDEHFDAVLHHLAGALKEAGAGGEDIAEVIAVAGSTRDAVLGR